MFEPTMQSIWLVSNTEAFGNNGETSTVDRAVDTRLTYGEWLAIYFDALGLDKSAYALWKKRKTLSSRDDEITLLGEFDDDIPNLPMLSRIRSPFRDVVFERDEVQGLREECVQVKSLTSNDEALRGIEKLLRVADEALKLGLSIYFVSN